MARVPNEDGWGLTSALARSRALRLAFAILALRLDMPTVRKSTMDVMAADARGGFETRRLAIRDLADDDLDAVLDVYASNPESTQLTEGSGGVAGQYDLGMLERDLAIARAMPGRHFAGIFPGDGEAVGALDWMEENASDGYPWVGLVIIRADRQRQGLASEAVRGLAGHLRRSGKDTIRAGVIQRNEKALAFARHLGFREVTRAERRFVSEETVVVLELRLAGGE